MHAPRNRELVRRFVEDYQVGADEQTFDELIHPDFVDQSRPPGIALGPEGVRQQLEGYRATFEGLQVTILHQVAEGDLVMTHKLLRGTHAREFMRIEPTGREVSIEVMDVLRLQDGRLIEHWAVVDVFGLLAQLGAPPIAASAG
jgi:predicted ester cyclase